MRSIHHKPEIVINIHFRCVYCVVFDYYTKPLNTIYTPVFLRVYISDDVTTNRSRVDWS